jgi:hypothetical protein
MKDKTMTTFVSQRVAHSTGTSPFTRSTTQRFIRFMTALGGIMVDSVRASRACESANTAAARRAVLDRFVMDSGRHALRDRDDNSRSASS